MLFMPRKKAIELRKSLQKDHAERLRKMNEESFKKESQEE